MRNIFITSLVLALGLFLVACQEQGVQTPQPKLAVVDTARVMRDSEPGKEGVKFLESRQAILQERLDAIQDRLEKNPNDEAAMQELQRVYAQSQQRMQAEQQNVVNLLFDTVQRVLNEYRASQGYDLILGAEAAAAFNPSADVTAAVIAEVNKQKLEFKPVPDSAVPAAPAMDGGVMPAPDAAPAVTAPADDASKAKAPAQNSGQNSKPGKAAGQTGSKAADKQQARTPAQK